MTRIVRAAVLAGLLAAGAVVVGRFVVVPDICLSLNRDTNWFLWWWNDCDKETGGGGGGGAS
jgi:hypothetical protein